MLNAIDISSWQSDLVVSKMTDTQGVIVKATGGVGYRNPCFKAHMGQVAASAKLAGLYHFARERGCAGSAQAEADYFIAAAKPYVGKAALWLDWEADAIALGPKWAKAWLDRVHAKTGVKPGIYMSKGVCNQYDWSAVVKAGYPLWAAQYPDYSPTGWQKEPWTDSTPFGAWGSKPRMFQYTSSGYVKGYGGPLDLDLFHGDRALWAAMAAKGGKVAATVAAAVSGASKAARAETVQRALVAAAIHRDMVEDDANGYSWRPRWGEDGLGLKAVTVGGRKYRYDRGSYDCSSSSITAWKAALEGTPWEHALDAAVTTHNMREVFVGSGLFSWKPMSFIASPGDLYLDEDRHVAMCQSQVPDLMSEFSWGDNGAYNNKVGDQTGREAAVNPFREEFDGILHYNGKADEVIGEEFAAPKGTLYRVVKMTKVRKRRKVLSDNVVGALKRGKEVRLVAVKKDDKGNTWGRIAEGPFKGRVMLVVWRGETRCEKVK